MKQARNRYTHYASKAKKEGFVQISDIFTETANQEKELAKRLFKLLEGGDVVIAAICLKAMPRPKCARPVTIRRRILSYRGKTGSLVK